MSDVTITVRGEHETRVVPEEGVVRVAVRAEGPERADVVARATDAATALRALLTARKDAGEVTEWSSGRVSVWSDRPWNPEGKRLALVHHASVDVSATFADLDALSAWVNDLAAREAIQIAAVEWQLTRATAKAIEAQVAAEAVHVAVERARAYATALGLSEVSPVEIADTGMLHRSEPSPAPKMMRAAAYAVDAAPEAGLQLEPADIVVSAGVEGRFLAR